MTTGGFSTAGTGFTARIITNPDADIAQDRTVTTAGAYTATAPLSGSAAWLMQVATFKAATTTGGDTTAPTVAITAPTGTVSGTVTITADATDNVGVAGVQFLVDSTASAAEDTTSPYAPPGTPRRSTNGAHTLTARARDTDGNTALSAPVTVNVANTPATSRTRCWRPASTCRRHQVPAGRPHAGGRAGGEDQGPAAAVHAARPDAVPAAHQRRLGDGRASRGSTTSRSIPTSRPTTTTTSSTPRARRTATASRASPPTPPSPARCRAASSSSTRIPQDANAEHHGGAITFGNDGKLYFTTGEHFQGTPVAGSDQPARQDPPHQHGRHGADRQPVLRRRRPELRLHLGPRAAQSRTAPTTTRPPGGSSSATSAATTTRRRARRSTSARGAPTTAGRTAKGTCGNPAYTNPIYSYPHNGRDAAITGGFVYHGTQFPSAYQGSYFFADYAQNWIKRLTFDANGNVNGVFNFEPADGTPDGPYGDIVYLTEGPDGALYYVDLGYSDISGTFGVSKIRRIRFMQSNQPPVALASANPTSGPAPLDGQLLERRLVRSRRAAAHLLVEFRRRHHVDRANPSHTYTTAGQYRSGSRSPTA